MKKPVKRVQQKTRYGLLHRRPHGKSSDQTKVYVRQPKLKGKVADPKAQDPTISLRTINQVLCWWTRMSHNKRPQHIQLEHLI